MRPIFATLTLAIIGLASAAAPENEPAKLTARQLEAVWADLIQLDDAGTKKAQDGVRALIAVPHLAVPFIRERVKPVPVPDQKRLGLLIVDLESSDFRTREAATRELEKLGPLAAPALEKKLTEKLGLETQRRVEAILQHIDRTVLTTEEMRGIRAVEVLQGIASDGASAVLKDLAKGADGAVVTLRARHALACLTDSK
jgi:hypothetical protein